MDSGAFSFLFFRLGSRLQSPVLLEYDHDLVMFCDADF